MPQLEPLTGSDQGVGRLEAENAVIGSLLIDEQVAPRVLSSVDINDFAQNANRMIFQAARALLREGTPIDPVTLSGKLPKELQSYMLQLMEITPTAVNWETYATIMHERASADKLRDAAAALQSSTDLEDCRRIVAKMTDILSTGHDEDSWTTSDMLSYFQRIQTDPAAKKQYIGYGIKRLDDITFTEQGDVVVIGGEPSSGKTAFSLMLALQMAKTLNVGYFSLETNKEKVADRLITSFMQLDFSAVKRQELVEADWIRFAELGSDFQSRRLRVFRCPGASASYIMAKSRSYSFDVIFVDYIQLVTPEIGRRSPRSEQIASISMALHTFAQTATRRDDGQNRGTLVVELAQLSRPDKSSKWRLPTMHDLKESGQLEQDADTIFLLSKNKNEDGDFRYLTLAKQKEGQLITLPPLFDGAHQTLIVDEREIAESKLRTLANSAKKSKQLRRSGIAGQQDMFQEVQSDDPDDDMPF